MKSLKYQPFIDLAKSCPSIAFAVEWDQDPCFSWDGDGSDPQDEGFYPYNVTVSASIIHNGELITGEDHLGGCYAKDEDFCPDINGHLNQMIQAALEELRDCISGNYATAALYEIAGALLILETRAQESYDAQRAELAKA